MDLSLMRVTWAAWLHTGSSTSIDLEITPWIWSGRCHPCNARQLLFEINRLRQRLSGSVRIPADPQVERDLGELMDAFDLECNNTSIPYGWRWMPGGSTDLAGMTLADALSLSLVNDMVKPLLPVSMLQGLESRFKQARKKLNDLAEENPKARWIDKVRIIQPTQPLLAPQINPEILETVQECLLADEIIDVEYRGADAETAHPQMLNPLGLVTRGQITYIVATARNYSDIRLYTMHRIAQASRTYKKCQKPAEFNLDE
jgi:hypothetical protein